MNRHTRTMVLNVAAGIAIASAATFLSLPATQADPGVVTANVNVRSGPGTSFPVVNSIPGGTPVDVQRCDVGYCFIQGRRVEGWVSAQYLRPVGGPVSPGMPFGLPPGPGPGGNMGPGPMPGPGPGPRPGVFPGPDPRAFPEAPPVYDDAQVCFYERTRFRGNSECYEQGESVRNLGDMAGAYQSIENEDGLTVQVCADRNFRDCRTYTTSASSLASFGDVVSLRVR